MQSQSEPARPMRLPVRKPTLPKRTPVEEWRELRREVAVLVAERAEPSRAERRTG